MSREATSLAVMQALSLISLQPGWNSYKGKRICRTAIAKAIGIVQGLPPDIPQPSVVPMSSGGIHLEWLNGYGGISGEIVIAGLMQIEDSEAAINQIAGELSDGSPVSEGSPVVTGPGSPETPSA